MINRVGVAHHPVGGLFLFLCLYLAGCASTPQSDRMLAAIPPEFASPHMLRDIPFFPQEDYQCGPAALASLLNWQGITITPEQLKEQVYIPERKGSLQIEMLAATRRQQLVPYILRPELGELLHEIRAGRPVLVFQNLGVSWYPQWHYAVVVGYNLQAQTLILHSGVTHSYVLDIHTFERTWLRARHWAMIVLKPGELPARPDEWRYLRASVGLERLKDRTAVEKAYRAGLTVWPHSRDLNMGMGNLFYARNMLDQAEKYYRKVVQDYPEYAPAYNNLAQVLADQGQYSEAVNHASHAVQLGGVHVKQFRATLDEIQSKIRDR